MLRSSPALSSVPGSMVLGCLEGRDDTDLSGGWVGVGRRGDRKYWEIVLGKAIGGFYYVLLFQLFVTF